MNKKITIEICAGSTQSAINAQQGGGDRIELCSALEVGGVTPSAGMILETRKRLNIPICVLLRPRAGDFVYSQAEMETLIQDIEFCKANGINGVVLGVLNQQGAYDLPKMKILANHAFPMEVVSHRAFDASPDPFSAIDALVDLGFHRILSNGQSNSVDGGIDKLKKLVDYANNRITVMPGGGVNRGNVENLLKVTGAQEIHLTAKKFITGYPAANIPKDYSETDVEEVKKVVQLVK